MSASPKQSNPNLANRIKSSIGIFTEKVTSYVRPSFSNIKKPDEIVNAMNPSSMKEKDQNFSSCENEALHEIPKYEKEMSDGHKVEQKNLVNLIREENGVENFENDKIEIFKDFEENKPVDEIKKATRSYRIKYPYILGDEKTSMQMGEEKEDRARRRKLIKSRFLTDFYSESLLVKQSERFLIGEEQCETRNVASIRGETVNEKMKDGKKMKKRNMIILEELGDRDRQMMSKHDEDEEWKDMNKSIKEYEVGAVSTQVNEELCKLREAISQINNIKRHEQNNSIQVPQPKEPNISTNQPLSTTEPLHTNTSNAPNSQSESKTEPIKLPIPEISSNPFLAPTAGLNLKDIIASKLKNPTNQFQNEHESLTKNETENKKILDIFVKAPPPNEKNGHPENNQKVDGNMNELKGNNSVFSFGTNMNNQTNGNNGNNINNGSGPFNFSKITEKFTSPLNSETVPQSPFRQYPGVNELSSQNHNQSSFLQSTPLAPQGNIQPQSEFQLQSPQQFHSPQFGQTEFGFNPQPVTNFNNSLSPALNMFIDSSKPTLFDEPRSRTEKKPKARGYRGNKERIH